MLKNKLIFPNGTAISSGSQTTNAIMWVEETESVNIGEDLVIGSAYANKIKARILTPRGGFSANAGDEVTLVKEENGTVIQCGVYILEKPERSSANSTVITGYDRLIKLDKDLSRWLSGLTGWPYRLIDFAGMVCNACDLTLVTKTVPNADFPVPKFFRPNVTGRQLMRWIGEICCRFCRANAEGNIEFAWYEPSGKTITPKGEYRYLAGSLSYDTFEVKKIDGVQLRLANSTDGALWPAAQYGTVLAAMNIRKGPGTTYEKAGTLSKGDRVTILEQTTLSDGNVWGRIPQGWARITGYIELSGPIQNPYVITGNAILLSAITDDMIPYLQVIKENLETFTYTPCKAAIPATLDIRAGHIVDVTDINGVTIRTVIMTKITKSLKTTLESTGNPDRESANAINNKTATQKAEEAVENQTHEDIFRKLTKNGKIKGFFVSDDILVINADYAKIINIVAEAITSGILKSKDGKTQFNLDTGEIVSKAEYATLRFFDGQLQLENEEGEPQITFALDTEGSFPAIQILVDDVVAGRKTAMGFSSRGNGIALSVTDLTMGGRNYSHKLAWKKIGEETVLVAND